MKKQIKWYNDGLKEIQVSEEEQIPNGFVKGRLPKPKKVDSIAKKISKEKLYKDYIIDNKSFVKLMDEYNLSKKELRCLITLYKIKKDPHMSRKNNLHKRTQEQSLEVGKKSSETQKKNWKNKSQNEKDAWSKKCSEVELNMSTEKRKKKADSYRTWWFSLTEEERGQAFSSALWGRMACPFFYSGKKRLTIKTDCDTVGINNRNLKKGGGSHAAWRRFWRPDASGLYDRGRKKQSAKGNRGSAKTSILVSGALQQTAVSGAGLYSGFFDFQPAPVYSDGQDY